MRIAIALTLSTAFAVLAAWPIYQTPRLIIVGVVGALLGVGIVLARKFLSPINLIAAALAAFIILSLAIAVPSAWQDLPGSLGDALIDILGSIVLGWKQLLTLELPVGSYQAMLMPFFIVMTLASCVAMWLRNSRYAAIPLVAPSSAHQPSATRSCSVPLPLSRHEKYCSGCWQLQGRRSGCGTSQVLNVAPP